MRDRESKGYRKRKSETNRDSRMRKEKRRRSKRDSCRFSKNKENIKDRRSRRTSREKGTDLKERKLPERKRIEE